MYGITLVQGRGAFGYGMGSDAIGETTGSAMEADLRQELVKMQAKLDAAVAAVQSQAEQDQTPNPNAESFSAGETQGTLPPEAVKISAWNRGKLLRGTTTAVGTAPIEEPPSEVLGEESNTAPGAVSSPLWKKRHQSLFQQSAAQRTPLPRQETTMDALAEAMANDDLESQEEEEAQPAEEPVERFDVAVQTAVQLTDFPEKVGEFAMAAAPSAVAPSSGTDSSKSDGKAWGRQERLRGVFQAARIGMGPCVVGEDSPLAGSAAMDLLASLSEELTVQLRLAPPEEEKEPTPAKGETAPIDCKDNAGEDELLKRTPTYSLARKWSKMGHERDAERDKGNGSAVNTIEEEEEEMSPSVDDGGFDQQASMGQDELAAAAKLARKKASLEQEARINGWSSRIVDIKLAKAREAIAMGYDFETKPGTSAYPGSEQAAAEEEPEAEAEPESVEVAAEPSPASFLKDTAPTDSFPGDTSPPPPPHHPPPPPVVAKEEWKYRSSGSQTEVSQSHFEHATRLETDRSLREVEAALEAIRLAEQADNDQADAKAMAAKRAVEDEQDALRRQVAQHSAGGKLMKRGRAAKQKAEDERERAEAEAVELARLVHLKEALEAKAKAGGLFSAKYEIAKENSENARKQAEEGSASRSHQDAVVAFSRLIALSPQHLTAFETRTGFVKMRSGASMSSAAAGSVEHEAHCLVEEIEEIELPDGKGKKLRARISQPLPGWTSFSLLRCDAAGPLPCGLCPTCVEKAPRSEILGLTLEQPAPEPPMPTGWHETLFEQADEVFTRLAGDDDLLEKEELVAASGGDFKLFDRMDTEGDDGLVSRLEWHYFLKRAYDVKARGNAGNAGADRWLKTMLASVAKELTQ